MQNNIAESLKGLRKIFNYYLAAIGMLLLTLITSLEMFNKDRVPGSPMKIFNIDIYPHYFSLVYGLLFLAFIFVMYLGIRNLRITIEKHENDYSKETDSRIISLFPWLTSPFHKSKFGPTSFVFAIWMGFTILAIVTISHFLGINAPERKIIEIWTYKYFIGSVDAISFVICLVLAFMARRDINLIKNKL
jgi:hypothetical protein